MACLNPLLGERPELFTGEFEESLFCFDRSLGSPVGMEFPFGAVDKQVCPTVCIPVIPRVAVLRDYVQNLHPIYCGDMAFSCRARSIR